MADSDATKAAGRRPSVTTDRLDPSADKLKLDLETPSPSAVNSDSEGPDVGRQIELEARNSIKYRTYRGAAFLRVHLSRDHVVPPGSYATLGLVPGLILTVVIAAIVLYTSLIVWKFCLRHPHIRDVCDIGQHLFWNSKIAWYLTAAMFLLNNTFIQVRLISFSQLIDISDMTNVPLGLALLATFSALTTFISVLLAMIFSGIEDHPAAYTPAKGDPIVRALPVPGTTFVSGVGAFLNISYTFIGQITLPSFIAEMKEPKDFWKSVTVVTIAEIIVFSLAGSIVYVYTGNQYMTAPAFGSLGNEVYKKVSFSFMVPTLIFLGVLYASVSARFIFFRLFEGTRHKGNHTVVGWAAWTGILAVLWVLAFIISEVIPFFSDLLSIMSSLFDSFFGFIFWGVAYLRMRREDYGPGFYKNRGFRGWAGFLLNITLIGIGLFFLGPGTYASIDSVILNYRAGTVGSPFSCASNGLEEDSNEKDDKIVRMHRIPIVLSSRGGDEICSFTESTYHPYMGQCKFTVASKKPLRSSRGCSANKEAWRPHGARDGILDKTHLVPYSQPVPRQRVAVIIVPLKALRVGIIGPPIGTGTLPAEMPYRHVTFPLSERDPAPHLRIPLDGILSFCNSPPASSESIMSAVRPLRRGLHLLGSKSLPRSAPVAANGSSLLRRQLASPRGLRTPLVAVARPYPRLNSYGTVRCASSAPSGPVKRTQLYDLHIARGAKMVPFAGYSMPLQYSDLSHVESHKWTREKASLFDVSHMVQHHLIGPGVQEFLMKITPSSVDQLKDNQSTLSCLLEEGTGGIVDDTVITRRSADTFYFVTNAGRRDEDLAFLEAEIDAYKKAHGPDSLKWEILSDRALVALQGPLAAQVLQAYIHGDGPETDLSTLYFGNCRSLYLTLPDGSRTPHPVLISRTGYTGEDGFEISIPSGGHPTLPTQVTDLLLSNPDQVRLAGLAARDSLRLEAGMCLYGNDISTAQTPPAASLGWVVGKGRRDPTSANFNGSSVILPQIASPATTLSQRRVGFTVEKGSPAREGAVIVDLNDDSRTQIGVVTSGLPSPSLGGTNIAMGYIKQGMHKKGTEVGILVRNKVRKASVVGMPWVESKFYRPKA
ncbi:Aminomethyltransferase, mitochondrial [Aspergillus tanneri]|uniref:aminomethyltransferase n=1 Tax=Aspergillus tanneri TaxID=1220188 RepID=A0A5M9MY54_9EURO|nr:Aminomethyltransferase, mitochondrial [Aspergillus tanneri]KAA8652042.1 Aminomethyltransferase, mitochondrial [Aspergillus tanneri]